MNHLARRGIHPPRDISLICSDPNLAFSWITPPIAHVRWDSRPVVRRAIDWVKNIAAGKPDLHQTLTKAELVEGGTIGPCPR
jgi:DNA-binding LacI/PurR family transcriptional regulator